MKTHKNGVIFIPWLLFITISILLGDYLSDGNFDTTYHLLQLSHHYLFRLRIENLYCLFQIYKQLLIELELIALQLHLYNYMLYIVLSKTVVTFYYQRIAVQTRTCTPIHQNNFLSQYKNSFELHTDISRANISFP
jgi:hypothetical protein